jgi:hypothetical protein
MLVDGVRVPLPVCSDGPLCSCTKEREGSKERILLTELCANPGSESKKELLPPNVAPRPAKVPHGR